MQAPRGSRIRPTSDRVREAIFSVLGSRIFGAEVLDLFAGTGALGLEALSRGAATVLFVEKNRHFSNVIAQNINALGLAHCCDVLNIEVGRSMRILEKKTRAFDLIFLDPPYRMGKASDTLRLLSVSSLLRPGGTVVAEHEAEEKLMDQLANLVRFSEKKYGTTKVSFYVKG